MSARPDVKRRWTGPRVVLVALFAAIALTVSGCDWAATWWDGSGKRVTVRKVVTDNLIFSCTVSHGTSYPRARCVLDKIRDLCRGAPQGFFSWPECVEATRHDLNTDLMDQAIRSQIGEHGPALDGDCLVYSVPDEIHVPWWEGHHNVGESYCR